MSEELTPKRGRGRPKGTGGNKRRIVRHSFNREIIGSFLNTI